MKRKKEITMYELLGLIKDGKTPRKIEYKNMKYTYSPEYKDYETDKQIMEKHYLVIFLILLVY